MAREHSHSPRRAARRAQHALSEAVRKEREFIGAARARATEPGGEGRGRILPAVLVVCGGAIVLVAVIMLLGGLSSIAVDAEALTGKPGKAVAAPFERLHAAQRAKVRKAMNAPFVLGVPRKVLDRIAECESHGDPRAIGGGGLYRGKYQFHRSTWAGVGGTGDPARASELEQDRRAAMLIKQSGTGHWPICG